MDDDRSSIPVTLALPIQNPSSSSRTNTNKTHKLPKPRILNPLKPHRHKNTKKEKEKRFAQPSSLVVRELERFGEVYERVEISKAKREVEMEEQRIGFAKEILLNRMDLFLRTTHVMEISKPN